MSHIADEIQKLQQLHDSGALTDEEFARAKENLLAEQKRSATAPASAARPPLTPEKLESETRQWAMILHLSMLAGFLVPMAGLVTPVIIWQWKKEELPDIDIHGKNAVNWIISEIIYLVISLALVFVVIGIPLLIALGLLGIIFPIIAGVKASHGVVWKYPLTITFLK